MEFHKKMLVTMGVQHFVNPEDPDCMDQVMALTCEGQGGDHAVDGSGVTSYQVSKKCGKVYLYPQQ